MPARYRFTADQRLLTPAEFKAVLDDAPCKAGHACFVLLARPNGLGHARLGFVIAKKRVRHAVDRNRVRRQVRESFRLTQYDLPAIDIVFMARSGLDQIDNAALLAEVANGWRRLRKRAAALPVANTESP